MRCPFSSGYDILQKLKNTQRFRARVYACDSRSYTCPPPRRVHVSPFLFFAAYQHDSSSTGAPPSVYPFLLRPDNYSEYDDDTCELCRGMAHLLETCNHCGLFLPDDWVAETACASMRLRHCLYTTPWQSSVGLETS